jgi:hypothetical protein
VTVDESGHHRATRRVELGVASRGTIHRLDEAVFDPDGRARFRVNRPERLAAQGTRAPEGDNLFGVAND